MNLPDFAETSVYLLVGAFVIYEVVSALYQPELAAANIAYALAAVLVAVAVWYLRYTRDEGSTLPR